LWTKIRRDVNQLARAGVPTILVATPGRLVDHLLVHKTRMAATTTATAPFIGGSGSRRRPVLFSDALAETPIAVFDEADRLVEGFRTELRQIISFLPRPNKRQTLLFSATIPRRLEGRIKSLLLSGVDDFVCVDCVERGLASAEISSSSGSAPFNVTALRQQVSVLVDQSYVELPSMDLYVAGLIELVKLARNENSDRCKMVIFFPTARLVRFFADVFAAIADAGDEIISGVVDDFPIFEMHSRLSQSARSRTRSKFVDATRGVLLTSDVSARGKLSFCCSKFSPFFCVMVVDIALTSFSCSSLGAQRCRLPRCKSCCPGKI